MPEPPPVEIRHELWSIVQVILHRHVPNHAVWAFGARAAYRKALL
jgi:hypothetical protein